MNGLANWPLLFYFTVEYYGGGLIKFIFGFKY